jgi:hypothetical protein
MVAAAEEMRPIRILGTALILLTIFGILFFFSPQSPGFFFSFFAQMPQSSLPLYLLIGILIFYFLTGVGVVLQRKWGYWLLKATLFMLMLGFPIGTYISYKTLSYMKKHQIKRHFGLA